MATAKTLRSISAGLESIDEKKAQLKRAFEELQAHSSLLPPSSSSSSSLFTNLKWDEIDSYFTSLQSGLQAKFALLKPSETDPKESQPPPQLESKTKDKASPALPESKPKRKGRSFVTEPFPVQSLVPARPELKSFCEKMDSFGLRDFLLEHPKERAAIRDELVDALKHARDPAELVVEAMQGVSGDGSSGVAGSGGMGDFFGLRKVAIVLLEALMSAKVEIGAQVKEKAMPIAVVWNRNLAAGGGAGEDVGFGKLCFLHLVAAFGLAENDSFNMNDLIDYAVAIAKHRQAVDLCRVIGFGDRIFDVIQKLIDGNKLLLAVKFIFQFELTEKFPPVPLLRRCINEARKIGLKARRTGSKSGKNFRQSWIDEAAKAITSLKSIIKIIDDYDLDTVLPKNVLLRRIEKLETEKNIKKRPAMAPGAKSRPPSKQQKLSVGKQSMNVGTASANSTIQLIEPQPHGQIAGVFADPYLSIPASATGLAGSAPTIPPYAGTSADIYGLSRTHMGLSGNLDPSTASVYPSESVAQPSYYDRPVVYSGYSYPPPEYHPTYYPQ